MKSIRQFFTATFLLLMLAGISAFAQTSTWDGTAVSWTQGTGTEDDPYLIASAQNLAYLAEMVNGGVNQYSGKWFKLTTDIDLNDHEWTPIGNNNTTSARFDGNFDGDNHSISGLKISSSTLRWCGLFGYVSVTGDADRVFKNLNVSGTLSTTASNSYCGGIVGYANYNTSFDNCSNSASASAKSYTGGLIGYANAGATVNNCNNIGTITSSGYSGGLIGYGGGTVTITDCHNSSSVYTSSSSYSYSGGLIGYGNSTITMNNCWNSGSVVSSLSTSSLSRSNPNPYSGGLIGYGSSSTTINNCSNSGNVTANLNNTNTGRTSTQVRCYSYSGGIIGYMHSGTINLCVNTGDISSTSITAGAGYAGNYEMLYTYSYSGGIAGYSYNGGSYSTSSSSLKTTISLCYNTGTISATANNTNTSEYSSGAPIYSFPGGILGYTQYVTNINNCYNRGNVTAISSKPSGYYSHAFEYASGIGYGINTNCYNTGTLTAPTDACNNVYKYGIGNTTTTNCYYLETCGSTDGNGTSKTEAAMKSASFPIMLNQEVFMMDLTPNANDGYPIFGSSVCNITTEPATNLDFTSATLNGRYEAGEFWPGTADMQGFEWKTASASDWTTVYTNVETPASYNLTGLTLGVTYNYRMFLRFGDQIIYGNTVDFTTRACDAAVSVTTENTTICNNTSATLTANATSSGTISSYSWSTGSEGTGITANAAGTYTVTVTDEFNCTAEGSITIATIAAPTAAISGNAYLCTGSSTTLTGQGGIGYVWSTGATTPMINVSEPNEYYVIARASNGCTDTAYITVANFNEVVISGNTTICAGGNTTLSVSEGTSYLWSTGATTRSISVTNEGLYSVTVTNAQCEANTSVYVSVNALPTPVITGTTAICGGASTTLTATGGTGYVWNNGATTASTIVSTSGNYRVTVTNANGCTASASTSVVSAPNPSVQITGNTTACEGTQIALTATGGTSYSWSNSANTATINPTLSGTYIVTAYNDLGCFATASAIVTINPNPQLNITAPHTICNNSSTTLEVSDNHGSTITSCVWSNGGNGTSIQVSPDATTNYTVTVTNNNGCMAQASTSVVVADQLLLSISGNTSLCGNESAELTVSGIAPANVSTYAWSNGANTASVSVSSGGTYSVIVTDVNGCTGYATTSVTASENPTATISGNLNVCSGNSAMLIANGGTSYQWSNGSTEASISVNAGGTYSVVVANGAGCTATASAIVTVNETPMPQISGDLAVCAGSSTTLTATGGDSFVWSNGSTNASVNVTNAGTYTVIASNANGCTASASATVNVYETPNVTISGNLNVCSGNSTMLIANGGTSYQWSNGSTEASISVTTGGTYSVVVANGAGCTATASAIVTVNETPMPQISGDLAVCVGSSTTLTATGGDSFVWSNGSTNTSINVTSAGTYTVIASNSNGCTASTSAIVNVYESPTVTISGNSSICDGGVTTLTAEGGNSYLWSTGFPGASINVNAAGTYSVIATGANGCTSSATMTVVQYSAPEVSITGNTTVCEGSSTTITANGGVSYQWSTGETGASISVDSFGVYSVTATGNGGCTATANATVFVSSAPTPSISGNLHICDNETTTLTANGGDSYMWSNGSTGNSIEVSNGGTYSVIVSNANGCTAMTSANVEAGHSVTNSITETAETEFIWNGQTYTATGDYTQSFMAANGCDSIVTLHLTITGGQQVQHYNIFVISNNNDYGTTTGTGVYEENEVVTITASANEGYEFVSWNDGNTESIRQIVVTGDATYIATFIPATGIEETSALEIALFPNPATDILNITSSETISEIEIVNVMGQVVRKIEVNSDNAVCDVEDLKAGVYVVRIHGTNTESVVSQQKFIKE